ncbi:TrkH family potassium uptake protein [Aquibaculum arenosum]|uniref:Trk system potassium uptake protein n=1 Tax=Aquibaculum arenosum TaxID=3032591 RepID=A0ABT5YQD0_9PROT|nr:TrkH family potassium uptake protein [Fodinicurvata sp. CAU 1616]MDF2097087.1 TrkH family potassium uptake protein [Fodinicurvata sp. CAU 1616]
MPDLKPVVFVNGVILSVLALIMLAPAAVDASFGDDDWPVFLLCSGLTLFIGVGMALASRGNRPQLELRQAFILTATVWVVLAIFSALPFTLGSTQLSYTDAFFEAMSGITTTGSTVIVGLDGTAHGILLWRALLQWLGGIGIIVTAISVLPMLRIGGMQLFKIEAFETDKVLPRAAQIAGQIVAVYIFVTVLAVATYFLLGMSAFDAVAHAMTTVSTAGYSTRDASFAAFHEPALEWAASLFMVLGSMPFVLYLRSLQGDWSTLLRDEQVRGMLSIMAVAIAALTLWLFFTMSHLPLLDALRLTTFNAISIMTGTGYATTSFDLWGGFAVAVFFLLMFIGGCAGSTSCGIKVFRFQVLYATSMTQLKRLMQPSGVFLVNYNGRPVTDQVSASVMSFFFLFIFCFAVLAAILGAIGLDFVTAVSSAATAMANVGPGLGPIVGPAGNFSPLPDSAKWLLSAGMLLGRLEIFTVLVLFMPSFWRS